jgi:hypothetical protein
VDTFVFTAEYEGQLSPLQRAFERRRHHMNRANQFRHTETALQRIHLKFENERLEVQFMLREAVCLVHMVSAQGFRRVMNMDAAALKLPRPLSSP